MNNIKLLISNINYYTFLLFLLLSPINFRLQIFALDFWFLTHIVNIVVNGFTFSKFKQNSSLVFIGLTFVFCAISLFYTQNISFGLTQLQTKLPMVIIPTIFFTKINPRINLKSSLLFLSYGFLISIIIIIVKSLTDIFLDNELGVLYNQSAIKLLQAEVTSLGHRLYWGMYGLLAFISIISLYRYYLKSKHLLFPIIILLVIISFFIILIEARILWIQLIFISILLIRLPRKKTIRIFSILGFVIILIFIIYYSIPSFIHLFYIKSTAIEQLQFSEPRLFLWPASWHCIKENYLTGYGIGDVREILSQYYQNKGNVFAANQKFIAHNQFFQIWLEVGIFGLLSIVVIFIEGIRLVWKKTQFQIFIGFYFVVFSSFFIESVLNRFQGVALFLTVFFLAYFPLKSDNNKLKDDQQNSQFAIRLKRLMTFLGLFILIVIVFLFILKPQVDFKAPETYITKPYIKYTINDIDNVDIPRDAKGFLYNYEIIKDNFNSINEFTQVVYSTENYKADTLFASIYCKVSKDFKGIVSLYIGASGSGYTVANYNFDKNHVALWQKLTNSKDLGKGIEYVIIYIKPQNKEFKGEVIFAYPEIIEK